MYVIHSSYLYIRQLECEDATFNREWKSPSVAFSTIIVTPFLVPVYYPFVYFGGLVSTDVLEHKNSDIAARKRPVQIARSYRYKPNTEIP
jgi:hypothetical protein